jgi:hypothetical protein
VWGSSSFNSTTDLKVGKTGSSSSDGTFYKGRIKFAAIPKSWVIQSITLRLNRIDSYSGHTLTLGGSTGTGFSASLSFSLNKSFSSGTGIKNTDLTAHAANDSELSAAHGTSTFDTAPAPTPTPSSRANERSNSLKPALIITYVLGTVWYHNGTQWVECLVYYHNGTERIQCIHTTTAGHMGAGMNTANWDHRLRPRGGFLI